ncbi:MAG: SRPBCC family protein [Planctomycetota bacterium]|jgi:hypothetical protein
MLKKILIGLVVIIVILVVVGFLLPTEYEVSRYIVIDAKPSKIHDHVGDLKRWDDWMTWKENDPSIEVAYGKKTTGVGARQTWTGKDGEGEIVFTSADSKRGVEYDMSMDQGKYTSKGAILYEEMGKSTRVTWTMSGDWSTPVVGGYMVLLFEPMIGGEFQKGLSNLKDRIETKK